MAFQRMRNMSAKLAPENISIGITHNANIVSKPTPPSRPVENATALGADPERQDKSQNPLTTPSIEKADTSARPPGKDPSVLPQSLFDAALIAEEYKPQTSPKAPEAQQAYFAPDAKDQNSSDPRTTTQSATAQSAAAEAGPQAIATGPNAPEQQAAAPRQQDNSGQSSAPLSDVSYPSVGNINAA
jgi:hypothetical protein